MKQISRGTRLSLGLASVAVVGVAFGAGASALTSSSARHGTYRPPHLDGTRERMFSSLHSLASASDAIVVATARSSTTSDEGGIPVTVTSVDVTRTLRGSVAGTTIPIHQLGAPGDALEGVPVLQSGKTYLLFLKTFHYVPGDDTGQYVATGNPAGVFLQEGGKYLRLDRESTMLPSSTDESQVLQAS